MIMMMVAVMDKHEIRQLNFSWVKTSTQA